MIDRIWLVRHASTDWSGKRWCGRTDLPLSAEGIAEAEELAIWLAARLPPDVVVVSSPARRARDTAEPIERLLDLRTNVGGGRGGVDVDAGLREVDFGRAEGWTWPEIERGLPRLGAALAAGASNVDWPDGETADAVSGRVGAAWQRLAERDRPVVAVCHGGVIRALLAGLGLDGDKTSSIAPASTLELHRVGRAWTVAPAAERGMVRER